jgi:hypothetical protein
MHSEDAELNPRKRAQPVMTLDQYREYKFRKQMENLTISRQELRNIEGALNLGSPITQD